MQKQTTEQKIIYTLRIASALCFIGHGAFGLMTKAIWCNYFGIFGIAPKLAYQLMPVVGTIDILFGLVMLFYPLRGVFAWLVIWGLFTASLRPLSGEPLAEFFERAGNYGAPFLLLLVIALGEKKKPRFFSTVSAPPSLSVDDHQKIILGLRLAAFLLFAGHAWLNLLAKKALLTQYTALGFTDPHFIGQLVGMLEFIAAFVLLLRPTPSLVFFFFLWKMSSELFYPSHEVFEWIERGGSYGILLALWFAIRHRPVANEGHRFSFPLFSKTFSVQIIKT